MAVPSHLSPPTRPAADRHAKCVPVSAKVARALGRGGEMRSLHLHIDSPTSSVVKTGTLTPSVADLRTVASQAAANGLDVHFMVVLLDNATNTYRGA